MVRLLITMLGARVTVVRRLIRLPTGNTALPRSAPSCCTDKPLLITLLAGSSCMSAITLTIVLPEMVRLMRESSTRTPGVPAGLA